MLSALRAASVARLPLHRGAPSLLRRCLVTSGRGRSSAIAGADSFGLVRTLRCYHSTMAAASRRVFSSPRVRDAFALGAVLCAGIWLLSTTPRASADSSKGKSDDEEEDEQMAAQLLEFTCLARPDGGIVGANGAALLHLAIDAPARFQAACGLVSTNVAQILSEDPNALKRLLREQPQVGAALAYLNCADPTNSLAIRRMLGGVWVAASLLEAMPEAIAMIAESQALTEPEQWDEGRIESVRDDGFSFLS